MLSTVLSSPRAIAVNIEIMRAFVRRRDIISSNKELSMRLDQLETKMGAKLNIHDQAIVDILDAIRALMTPDFPTKKRSIGFIQTD